MIQDTRYQNKLAFRSRGCADLARRVGGVMADIDLRLARRPRIRLLELGCGYGTVMLELRQRYGERLELCGINRRPRDGDADAMRRNGTERGLLPDAASGSELPALLYADVAAGLPFADGSFDIVYSQVAWLYFGNKIGVLREVSRVLRHDGLARIDADEVRHELPQEYGRLVEIWHDGRLLSFGDYLRGHGMSLESATEGEYLHFGKTKWFGEDLERIVEIDVSTIDPAWSGIKCVYRKRKGLGSRAGSRASSDHPPAA